MKLTHEDNPVDRVGTKNTEHSFQIKTTAKAFDILSAGLYTDNILAVVRELSCNAYDAQVAANRKHVPFEIHLPNQLEPWFHVKDTGIGLSDEDVVQIYTTYFESTKTDSNDYIGALGLGSKSPFSYVKSFDVVSNFNGKRRTYTAFISEYGVPTITKMNTIDTDERNGITIRIPVKQEDFDTFDKKTAEALKWFDVKPNVVGAHNFQFPKVPEASLKGKNWILIPIDGYNAPQMIAVQGNVGYPIDLNHLDLHSDDALSKVDDLLRKATLVAFYDIGELEVAASREEIRYDDRSKAAIMNRLNSYTEEFIVGIQRDFEALHHTNIWDLSMAVGDMSKSLFGCRSTLPSIVKSMGGTTNDVFNAICKAQCRVRLPKSYFGWTIYRYTRGSYSTGRQLSRKHVRPGSHIEPGDNIHIVLNDKKTGGVKKLNHHYQTVGSYDEKYYVLYREKEPFKAVVSQKTNKERLVKMSEKEIDAEFDEIVKSLGEPEIWYTSQMEKAPSTPSSTTSLPVFTFGGAESESGYRGYNSLYRINWNRVDEIDFDDGGLYLDLRHRSKMVVTHPDSDDPTEQHDITVNARLAHKFLTNTIELINKNYPDLPNYTLSDLYALGSMAKKKVVKRDNWHNIFDLARECIDQYVDDFKKYRNWGQTEDNIGLIGSLKRSSFCDRFDKLKSDSTLRTILEPVKMDFPMINKNREFFQYLRNLESLINHNSVLMAGTASPYFVDNDIYDKYPMLKFVSSIDSCTINELDDIFEYINTIDKE